MWTRFFDMSSGGGSKEKWDSIYIEAPEDEAIVIFYNRFGHNPHRVTCTCCGADYSLTEYDTLEEATKFDLEFSNQEDMLIIYAKDILPEERVGDVPEQGYAWQD